MRGLWFRRVGIVGLAIAALACRPQSGDAAVVVSILPDNLAVNVGDTFDIQLSADLFDPVLGWGLDVAWSGQFATQAAAPTIGPLWYASTSVDGDDLIGMAFPDAIAGSNVLLATLHLKALSPGQTDITITTTPGDQSEGFPLDPSGFADAQFESAHLTVLPEPTTAILLLGLTGLVWSRRRPQ